MNQWKGTKGYERSQWEARESFPEELMLALRSEGWEWGCQGGEIETSLTGRESRTYVGSSSFEELGV